VAQKYTGRDYCTGEIHSRTGRLCVQAIAIFLHRGVGVSGTNHKKERNEDKTNENM